MAANGQDLLRMVASGQAGPWWLSGLRAACRAGAALYGAGAWLDRLAHERGGKKRLRLPGPLIGVGNLAVGGAGKTPLTLEIVRRLTRLGAPAAVMSRGYGRRSTAGVSWVWREGRLLADAHEAGDEPVLLARRLGVPVAVGADRHAVGLALLAHCPDCVLVADDLFQHHRLHRDLDIVALDASDPLGGGFVLPRGLLREPPTALARADALVLTKVAGPEQIERATRLVEPYLRPGAPLLACAYRVDSFCGPHGQTVAATQLRGRKAAAFCGLARPESFVRTLEGLGLEIAAFTTFADHHFFTADELRAVWRAAEKAGAQMIVCTEKDRARLIDQPPMTGPPLYSTVLDVDFGDDSPRLDVLLRGGLEQWAVAR